MKLSDHMTLVNNTDSTTLRSSSHRKVESSLKPIFVVGGLYTEGSGVARIVCDIANHIADHGTPVDVYTAACNGRPVASHMLREPNRCFSAPGRWLGRLSHSPQLKTILQKAIPKSDVVHNHSVWMLPNSYATNIAFKHKVPVIYTAHGFFEPWAMARSRFKKRIAGFLFQKRDLHKASCFHVNSESEIAGIRSYGLRNPIAVIPNGVDIDYFNNLPEQSVFWEKCPEVKEKRVCLFLSRLHEKKGVRHLIDAWKNVSRDNKEWHLVIAGPDDGMGSSLQEKVADLNLETSVTITGALYGEDKLAALSAADAFILPSFSEGFSMAILEAMACRLPVILTSGCNFPESVSQGAAIEIQPNKIDTERGLREMFSLTDDQRSEMGSRGRALIDSTYSWNRIAGQTLNIYQWLTMGKPRPSTVIKP